jgi:hypothetical protein
MPLDTLTRDTVGRSNVKDGANGNKTGNGPFAYGSANRDQNGNARGFSAGIGAYSGPIGNTPLRADALQAQGHFGGWTDDKGKTNVGAEADAAVVRLGMERTNIPGLGGFGAGFDGELLSANAGGKFNDETASFGAQANIASIAGTLGTEEHNARFGVSAGVGLAGRAHYGDADGDGVRELGFGADFGPVSFDVKSELLGHAWNGISSAGSAIGGAASSAWDAVTSW